MRCVKPSSAIVLASGTYAAIASGRERNSVIVA